MTEYGFADWEGNDRHFMGWAGTGVHFDPIIASNAAGWLRANATTLDQPWFLTVALVNPHDVMWFPIDQPYYGPAHPDDVARTRSILEHAHWKDDDVLPLFSDHYDEVCDELPANFGDDLLDKPDAQRQWRWDQQHGLWGYIDPSDKKSWLRHLDYYVKLQQMADVSLGTVMSALEASGAYDDTVVIVTSDHGDMCGSHGLRSKGPFVYEEIMHVPCIAKVPGVTQPGSQTVGARHARGPRVDDRVARWRRPDDAAVAARGRPLAGARRSVHHRPRPRAVRARHRAHEPDQQHALRDPRILRRPAPSTRATTASVAASRAPDCGARTPDTSSTTWMPRSPTRSTSGTTSPKIRTSWPTSPTTAAAATSSRPTTNASSSTKPSNSRNKPELA